MPKFNKNKDLGIFHFFSLFLKNFSRKSNKNNKLHALLSRCLPMTCGLTFGHFCRILYIESLR